MYNVYRHQDQAVDENSLSMTADEVKSRIDRGDRYVVRILIPENQTILFTDLIRGVVNVSV